MDGCQSSYYGMMPQCLQSAMYNNSMMSHWHLFDDNEVAPKHAALRTACSSQSKNKERVGQQRLVISSAFDQ